MLSKTRLTIKKEKPLIELINLSKNFRNKIVLEKINLKIYKTQRIAILGANGAGKTTLVELISQNIKPSSGQIKYNLKDKNIQSQIGIQYQEGNWIPGLTANDVLKFYKKINANYDKNWYQKLLDIFEINEFINRHLNKLSGGQKQRFNALLAIINNPQIIILDELTTGLDMQLQFSILKFFQNITSKLKKTLLIVSHIPEEVELLCNRVIIVGNNKIVFDDSITNIKSKYKTVRNLMQLHFKELL